MSVAFFKLFIRINKNYANAKKIQKVFEEFLVLKKQSLNFVFALVLFSHF